MGALHLTKFERLPEVELIGIFEPNLERAKELSHQLGVRTYHSLEELLFLSEAVVVASPTHTHYAVAKHALESGCHVLIEKPMCETVEEAAALDHLAQAKGLICQVGFLERFRLQAMLGQDRIPSTAHLESQRLSMGVGREPSVDVISDLMIHDLDLVLSLVKEDPIRITAEGFSVVTDYLDLAKARLEFSNGVVATLQASRVAPKVVRSLKVISLNYFSEFDFVTNSKFMAPSVLMNSPNSNLSNFDALEHQAKSFVRSIQSNSTPIITAIQGAKVIELTQKIRDSIRLTQVPLRALAHVETTALIREH